MRGPDMDAESREAASGVISAIRAAVGGPIISLALGGAGLIVAIGLITIIAITNFRDRALEHSKQQVENSALLFARHFNHFLEDFAAVQRDFALEMASSNIDTPDDLVRKMSAHETHAMLKAKIVGSSDVAGINVWGPDGKLINSSLSWPVPDRSVAERAYFKKLKSDPSATPMQIELVRSTLTGNWAIVVAQKITTATGEFAGIASKGFSPSTIEGFIASTAPDSESTIALVHTDGTVVARFPHFEGVIGRHVRTPDLRRPTVQVISPLDGVERIISIRRVDSFPLILSVSTTVAAALAEWHQQTRFLAGVGLLSSLVIGLTLVLIIRQLIRQHDASRHILRLEKERFATAVNNMTQGLLLFDVSERLILCNDRYIEMFGVSREVIKPGCTLRELIQHRKDVGSHPSDHNAHYAEIQARVQRGKIERATTITRDRTMQSLFVPLAGGGWLVTLEDVTERMRYEERIAHLAHYDSLTDLPNRALFRERLQQAIEQLEPGEQLAVLYIDIDEFKAINDSLGHPVGDGLLQAIAARLRGCGAEGDVVARLGGDEFAMFRPRVRDRAAVADLVDRIFASLRAPFDYLDHTLTVDASIGIAMGSSDLTDLDQLVQNADLALYEAKSGGRHTARFFDPAMQRRLSEKRTMEIQLRQAITRGELEVHYQPILGAQDETIVGCEALIRWRHPQRGLISPADFVPVAEETGMINEIGEWVLDVACRDAANWPAHVRIAVNVSPVQFRNPAFALKVVAALSASGLPARRLELEVTETVLIKDDDTTLAVIRELRSFGIRIALDDFGTGYSSLSHLQRFPLDKIKIDRSFIGNVTESADSAAIVRAVVDIAAIKQITTTAEGVETDEQKKLLLSLGCAEMQGYLFSPARPAADIAKMLAGDQTSFVAA